MIKFFRNIRKSLLNEGKTTRYFKYAIGEIVLVVIGILIALQINNWNENRKNEEMILTILEEIQANIITDAETINRTLKLVFKEQSMIIDVKDGKVSELGNLLTWIGTYEYNIDLTTSGYEKLIANTLIIPKEYDSVSNAILQTYKRNLSFFGTHNQRSRDIVQRYKYYIADNKEWFPDWEFDNYHNKSNQNDFNNDPILLNQLLLYMDVISVITNWGRIVKKNNLIIYEKINEITKKDSVIPISKFYYEPSHKKIFESYAGLFKSKSDSYADEDVTIEFANDTLYFKGIVNDGPKTTYNEKYEMIPLTDSLFYLEANLPYLKFSKNSKTNELQLLYQTRGEKYMFKKINN